MARRWLELSLLELSLLLIGIKMVARGFWRWGDTGVVGGGLFVSGFGSGFVFEDHRDLFWGVWRGFVRVFVWHVGDL